MKKNRTALIALVAGIVVIVGGAWWFTSSHASSQSAPTVDPNDPDHKKAAEAYQKGAVHAGEMQAAAEQAYIKARERARKKAEAAQGGTPPASGAVAATPAVADTPK